MSFGFSVGDFVAVSGLIVKLVDALRDGRSEYQELIRELESLDRALTQVEKLTGQGDQSATIDQIKYLTLTCRYPLEDFPAKIQKYERSLGSGNSVSKVKAAGKKVQYAFGWKNEVNTLRSQLTVHIGTINMLLTQHGLETLAVASAQRKSDQEELKVSIEGSSRDLKAVKDNVEDQAVAIRENNWGLRNLLWIVSGEIVAPLKSLSQTLAQVCASTHQIYTPLLEIRASVRGVDTRFTFFQAPVRVEDALGRVFLFASECSVEALHAEIKARFKEGPGQEKVMAEGFEIFDTGDPDRILTIYGRNRLLPGMSVSMAIIFEGNFNEGDKCPIPHCASRTFVEAVGGGRTW